MGMKDFWVVMEVSKTECGYDYTTINLLKIFKLHSLTMGEF